MLCICGSVRGGLPSPMEYPFPPPIPPQISLPAFAVNALLMLIALAVAFGVFRKNDYPSRRTLWQKCGIVVALVTGVCVFGLAFQETRLYMDMYFGFVWA